LRVLSEGLNRRLAAFSQKQDAATQLISAAPAKEGQGTSPVELAAYTTTANVLLNLDEVITRE
jgi:hypothetical protein